MVLQSRGTARVFKF